jgi:hypothetical protein
MLRGCGAWAGKDGSGSMTRGWKERPACWNGLTTGKEGTVGVLPRFFGCEMPALALPCSWKPFCRLLPNLLAHTTARLVNTCLRLHIPRACRPSRYLLAMYKLHRRPCDLSLGTLSDPVRACRVVINEPSRDTIVFHLTCFLPVQQQLPVDIGDWAYGERRFCHSIRQRLHLEPCQITWF